MSDNEEFPDIELCPVKRLDEVIDVDVIVLAKWKGVYWPALVRRCDKKLKKASIVYTDSPCNENGKEMRHNKSFKDLINFDYSSLNKLSKSESGGDEKWHTAVELAKDYVSNRASDKLFVSPLEYFLNPIQNLLADPNVTNGEKSKTQDTEVSSTSKRLKTLTESSPNESTNNNTNDTSDASHTDLEEDDDPKLKCIIERIGAKIKEVTESDACKKYLLNVAKDEGSSYRHNHFTHGTINQAKNLKYICFDKIVSDSQVNDIIESLKKMFDGQLEIDRGNALRYILDVMLPEALIFAMQQVLRISKKKADNILKGTHTPDFDKIVLQFGEETDTKEESSVVVE